MRGADLLASLPKGWKRYPLKHTCDFAVSNVDKLTLEEELSVRLCNYTDVYRNERVSPDMELMMATATRQEIKRFHLEAGDVVITKDSESWSDIGIAAYVERTADDFVCGYHLALIRPRKEVLDGRFLLRCIQSRPVALQLELEATGVTRYGLPKDAIGLAVLPLPPLPSQRLIANYLDRETARIDSLIAEKERMLALLDEKRSALISSVVTRGLDPNAPLKPSGLDWLGEIPVHWRLERMKFHLLSLEQGWSPLCDNYPAASDDWGVLKVGSVNDWTLNSLENKRLPDDVEPIYQYEIKLHDVLMSRANTSQLLGSVVYVGEVSAKLLLCDKLYRLHVNNEELNREFLVAYLRARPGRFQLERDATGTSGSMQNIGQDTVRNMLIALPPLDEQVKISRVVTDALRQNKKMEEALRRSVDLLRERRASLITTAVTGQIPLEDMK